MRLVDRIFVLMLVVALPTHAQQIAFRRYSQKDGLTSNNIRQVLQDDRGILWIGTDDGLCWYDGTRFREVSVPVRAHQLFVNNIMADRHSNIWISTYYNGLYRYDKHSFKNYLIDKKNTSAGCNSIFQTLEIAPSRYLVATDDNAWTFDGGVFRLFDPTNPLLKRQISAAALTTNGDLLLAIDKGLFYYHKTARGWVNEGIYLTKYAISKMICVGVECWMATNAGLLYFDSVAPGKMVPAGRLFNGPVSNVSFDADKGVLAVRAHEIYRLEKARVAEKVVTKGNGMEDFSFTDVFFDRERNMWLGSFKGLLKINDPTTQFFAVKKKEGADPYIISLCPVNNVLWMGTFNGLIRKQGSDLRYITTAAGKPIGYVLFMTRNKDGSITAGTSAGLLQIADGRRIRVLDSCAYSAFYKDNNGVIWMAANNKYAYYKDGRTRTLYCGLRSRYRLATAIYVDSLANCWVGYQTEGVKLFRIKRDTLVLVREYLNHFDENSRVRDLAPDGYGQILVGSRTEGLFILPNPTLPIQKVEHVDEKKGLKGKWVKGMLQFSKDSFIIITNNGAFILTLNREHFRLEEIQFTFTNVSNEFYGTAYWRGHILITADGGYFDYRPRRAAGELPAPFTYISAVLVNNKSDTSFQPYTLQRRIRLFSYFENNISIEYTSTSFENEEFTNFRYRLIGVDKSWSELTNLHKVNYSGLPAGRYKFEVLAQNSSNYQSAKPAVYDFEIMPPVWKRWWFTAISVLLTFIVLYAGYKYRLNSLLAVERLRMKISTDLHDDVGSSLSSITILSQMALMDGSESPMAETVKAIKNNSVTLMERIDDIVWSLRPNFDTLDSFLLRLKQFASELFEAQEIDYYFSVPESLEQVQMPMEYRHHVFLIVKEAINNLAKHAKCTEVNISVTKDEKQLSITIQDNGIGFDPGLNHNGNGLSNMRHRAQLMGATLTLDATPGKGARVCLTVKIK